jgi:hypothetical protein
MTSPPRPPQARIRPIRALPETASADRPYLTEEIQ